MSIFSIGAALYFLDIDNQEITKQAVRIFILNEREGIQRLTGSKMVITVYCDENASRFVGVEERIFRLASLAYTSTV